MCLAVGGAMVWLFNIQRERFHWCICTTQTWNTSITIQRMFVINWWMLLLLLLLSSQLWQKRLFPHCVWPNFYHYHWMPFLSFSLSFLHFNFNCLEAPSSGVVFLHFYQYSTHNHTGWKDESDVILVYAFEVVISNILNLITDQLTRGIMFFCDSILMAIV